MRKDSTTGNKFTQREVNKGVSTALQKTINLIERMTHDKMKNTKHIQPVPHEIMGSESSGEIGHCGHQREAAENRVVRDRS